MCWTKVDRRRQLHLICPLAVSISVTSTRHQNLPKIIKRQQRRRSRSLSLKVLDKHFGPLARAPLGVAAQTRPAPRCRRQRAPRQGRLLQPNQHHQHSQQAAQKQSPTWCPFKARATQCVDYGSPLRTSATCSLQRTLDIFFPFHLTSTLRTCLAHPIKQSRNN